MRDLSDSGLYFLSTQRAGLQLQGTLHAQVTGGERKKVKAWTYSIYKYLKNYNKKKFISLFSLVNKKKQSRSVFPFGDQELQLWIHTLCEELLLLSILQTWNCWCRLSGLHLHSISSQHSLWSGGKTAKFVTTSC